MPHLTAHASSFRKDVARRALTLTHEYSLGVPRQPRRFMSRGQYSAVAPTGEYSLDEKTGRPLPAKTLRPWRAEANSASPASQDAPWRAANIRRSPLPANIRWMRRQRVLCPPRRSMARGEYSAVVATGEYSLVERRARPLPAKTLHGARPTPPANFRWSRGQGVPRPPRRSMARGHPPPANIRWSSRGRVPCLPRRSWLRASPPVYSWLAERRAPSPPHHGPW